MVCSDCVINLVREKMKIVTSSCQPDSTPLAVVPVSCNCRAASWLGFVEETDFRFKVALPVSPVQLFLQLSITDLLQIMAL